MNIKRIIYLIISANLISCASVKEPQTNLVNELNSINQQVSDGDKSEVRLQKKDWWQEYKDPQLDILVAKALTSNVDYLQKALDINIALYQANQIGADLVPSFSNTTLNIGASQGKNLNTGESIARTYSSGLKIQYELDLWQKIVNAKSAAEWLYNASLEDKNAARDILIANIVDSYFYIQYLQQYISLTKQNIKFYIQQQNITYQQYKQGKISNIASLQAKQALLNEQNKLLGLQNNLQQKQTQLRNLLNLRPNDKLDFTSIDMDKITIPKISLEIPVTVLANRPDLKAAEARLQSAYKSAKAEQLSLYPSISISGAINFSSSQSSTLFKVPLGIIDLGINFPILQWNKLKWGIKISETQYEKTKLSFIQSLNTALNEVNQANYNYQIQLDKDKQLFKLYSVTRAQTNYYLNRYKEGLVEYSDYLDKQQAENNAKASLLEQKYNILSAASEIFKTMAGSYVKSK